MPAFGRLLPDSSIPDCWHLRDLTALSGPSLEAEKEAITDTQ
jgi:hypothetical protein